MDIKILEYFLILFVLIFFLVKSADLVEESFVVLAKKFGVSEFILGFVLLSAISSLPEISIAITSNSIAPVLSIGNLYGATLVLLSLVAGLSAIKFGNIDFKGKFDEKEVVIGLSIITTMILAVFDGELVLFEGIILIGLYFIYIIQLSRRFRSATQIHIRQKTQEHIIKLGFKSILGSAGILLSAKYIVDISVSLGTAFGVSEALIGLLVLAIGTNLPELTILFRAQSSSQKTLAVGNIIGSATINTLIFGVLVLISGGLVLHANDFIAMIPVIVILSLTIVAFVYFSWTGRKLTRNEGFLLIACYVSLVLTELLILLSP